LFTLRYVIDCVQRENGIKRIIPEREFGDIGHDTEDVVSMIRAGLHKRGKRKVHTNPLSIIP